ncbi:hypothetical protein QFC21_001499 [Naganishia friedmannii]|uniref:Uncharacterized protein n=1 Tax=Naganishia friedmannii TaxID=89922 RepID=A0ACC2W4M9_9TREE|nr:hypothetical protein QFC21_001499 [Naganishia friedmannii]
MPVAPSSRSSKRLKDRAEVAPTGVVRQTRSRTAGEESARSAKSAPSSAPRTTRSRSTKSKARSSDQSLAAAIIAEVVQEKKPSKTKTKKKNSKKRSKDVDSARAPDENDPVAINPDAAPVQAHSVQPDVQAPPGLGAPPGLAAPPEFAASLPAFNRLHNPEDKRQLTAEEVDAVLFLLARPEFKSKKAEAIVALGVTVMDVVEVTPALTQDEINCVADRTTVQASTGDEQSQAAEQQSPQAAQDQKSEFRVSQDYTETSESVVDRETCYASNAENPASRSSKKRKLGSEADSASSTRTSPVNSRRSSPVNSRRSSPVNNEMYDSAGGSEVGRSRKLTALMQDSYSQSPPIQGPSNVIEFNEMRALMEIDNNVQNTGVYSTFASGSREGPLETVFEEPEDRLQSEISDENIRFNMGLDRPSYHQAVRGEVNMTAYRERRQDEDEDDDDDDY